MKSLQHVLWRGALALSLVAAGIGSGLGMPPVERTAPADFCTTEARLLAAHAIVPIYFYTSKHLVRPEVRGFEANPLDRHPSRFLSWAAKGGAP